jgi:hypothetical protein
MNGTNIRIVCFGDTWGISLLYRHLFRESITGIVSAEVRPQYHQDLRAFAASSSIDFMIQPRRDSSKYRSFINRLEKMSPDLIIVNSYSMLLGPEVLSIPIRGAINIHGALLPQYRGANPIQWALINNESETGVTMHYIDEQIDTGDVISQKKCLFILRIPGWIFDKESLWQQTSSWRNHYRRSLPVQIAALCRMKARHGTGGAGFPKMVSSTGRGTTTDLSITS